MVAAGAVVAISGGIFVTKLLARDAQKKSKGEPEIGESFSLEVQQYPGADKIYIERDTLNLFMSIMKKSGGNLTFTPDFLQIKGHAEEGGKYAEVQRPFYGGVYDNLVIRIERQDVDHRLTFIYRNKEGFSNYIEARVPHDNPTYFNIHTYELPTPER